MSRTLFGAFEAILGRATASSSIAREAAVKQLWTQRLWHQQRARLSQLRAPTTRPTQSPLLLRNLKTPFQQRRPFSFSRARRSDAAESLSLGQRLKKLSREYGWTAVGIYFSLSVLDFPFCFLLVRTVGTERVAHIEHIVVSNLQKIIPDSVQTAWRDWRQARREATGQEDVVGHGVAEAEERNKQEGASLATQLALAYAIHKSFIFIRVPLTAAITPKIVKTLRSWGWQIGKRPVRPNKKLSKD
ncbi:hypothetical protein QBC38DRAFT_281329 [Podospora fimiseda]|uniref:DUF1279 domain-containing protein n=1 Tax=Podospora fimiseda TaxID=252190 RepID=A0AAN7H0J3_9PEZI|nr:hypothetical protein QBC38DRAFT_281329 [Podospora fimiseda]